MRFHPFAAVTFLLLCGPALVSRPIPVGFDSEAVLQHRLSGSDMVKLDVGAIVFSDVTVRLTIGPDGSVTQARAEPSKYENSNPAPALAEVRRWKFRPFLYRGKPVSAIGTARIEYLPRDRWQSRNAPFPEIDYGSLRIELTRSNCYGSCPEYRVKIDGEGNVVYTGNQGWNGGSGAARAFDGNDVLLTGEHRAKIDRAALDALIGRFRQARFFGLRSRYASEVSDHPTYSLVFSVGGKTVAVEDYDGLSVGMPAQVRELEDEVDRVAGTARWLTGDATTVAHLRAEGFDPLGPEAPVLARGAVLRGGDAVALDLIAAGMDLDGQVPEKNGPSRALGLALLADALRSARPVVAQALIARGWLSKMPAAERASLFAETAGGCDPQVARAMVAAGVDPNARSPISETSMERGGGTALHIARYRYGPCYPVTDRHALIGGLLALRVDPNIPNVEGKTPIYEIEDLDLLELFLGAGARVDVKDGKGFGPALSSWTEAITLRLLEAGADPRGKNFNGKSLRQMARERDMPAVLAWLDAHGVK